MGVEPSKIEYNISKSESSSNSGKEKEQLEEKNFQQENNNTIIYRVWIVKRSISLTDGHVNLFNLKLFLMDIVNFYNQKLNNIVLIEPRKNIFEIKNEYNSHFKHWALILELSNWTYVNIQFGNTGFAVEEFNRTSIEGENILNAILKTWGEKTHPFSFCYLGMANVRYDYLKRFLENMKYQEEKYYKEKKKTYYNAAFYNCQHFSCDIERILFGQIYAWHSFEIYLDKFFEIFFPEINVDNLKKKHSDDINKENEKLFKKNVKNMEDCLAKIEKIQNEYIRNDYREYFNKTKKKLEKLYSMKYESVLK